VRPYADTNFFTRYYLELPESEVIARLTEAADLARATALPVTWFHRLELCNAVQLHVFQGRSLGQKRVTPEQAAAALAVFRDDLSRGILMRNVSLPTSDLERQFEELSLRHTPANGFRTYDIIHVSAALLLGCDTFWSFDPKATRLAALEGFKTV
jgi:predicted nucleic acid-binding protein